MGGWADRGEPMGKARKIPLKNRQPVELIEGRNDWRCSFVDGAEAYFDPDGRLQSFSLSRSTVGVSTLQ